MSMSISGKVIANSVSLGSATLPSGQQAYTTAGTFSFVVPSGVTSISAVAVGGGGSGNYYTFDSNPANGGAGGALAYVNSIAVTPGETLTVIVGAGGNGYSGNTSLGYTSGGASYLRRSSTDLVGAGGGETGRVSGNFTVPQGGSVIVGTGGAGGNGGRATTTSGTQSGGGGGAGGYSGAGGVGANWSSGTPVGGSGAGGAGGGGSGSSSSTSSGRAAGGGGVGILGTGTSGTGGTVSGSVAQGGTGGSGGVSGTSASTTSNGGNYGAGGGGGNGLGEGRGAGGVGAVRIIWGSGRSYPSNAANV